MKRLTVATVVALMFALAGCAGTNQMPSWGKDEFDPHKSGS